MAAPVKPDGWYTVTEQYTPPQIQYKSTASHPTFAICNDGMLNLEFMQLPGKPIYLRETAPLDPTTVGSSISVTINELGRLALADGLMMCLPPATGDEFNPLTEVNKYGMKNDFQDPSRGTIDSCEVTAETMDATCVFN